MNDDPYLRAEAARAAGLRYVSDDEPGYRRKGSGRGFSYYGPDGALVRDRRLIDRFRSLAIPPAYRDVWICRHPNGHVQATGRDARNRKQYRYHPLWREVRDATKFSKMIPFGHALPAIRAASARDLRASGLPRHKVLGAVVHLLDRTLVRIGNQEYAEANNSFGLTTLTNRHVRLRGDCMTFSFRGKGGKDHSVELTDPRLARIIRSCQELPGQKLFSYLDEDDVIQSVSSQDVNDYLRNKGDDYFSAKDFRTWAATVLAGEALQRLEPATSETAARRNITAAMREVSEALNNTPAICRNCYVHPQLLERYLAGSLLADLEKAAAKARANPIKGLSRAETTMLAFLKHCH